VSGLILFSSQVYLQTYEWVVLACGCGPRTRSFSLAMGDIEHDAEESMEYKAI